MAQMNFPPGPKGTAFIGNVPELRKDILGFYSKLAREYGDVAQFRIRNDRYYLISHPEDIEHVLLHTNRKFIKGYNENFPVMEQMLGLGLLTSEREFWIRQRRLIQPAFHKDRIHSFADTMVDQTNLMMQSFGDGKTCDIHQQMMKLTLNIVVKTLFSSDVQGKEREVGEALESFMKIFINRFNSLLQIPLSVPTPGNLQLKKAVAQLDRLIYRIIEDRRNADAEKEDLLQMLLDATDEDGSTMNDKQLRDELVTLFIAGHETTANTLAYTWYLLCKHPRVEEQLDKELREVLGGRDPVMQDLGRLEFATKIIKESMRLYPTAWVVGRKSIEDTKLAGYDVPKGTNLEISQWVVHRDARYYSEPDRFQPERWTPEFETKLPKYAYFPFGGGPRLCIGNNFAMMEAVLLLASVAQQWRMELTDDQPLELEPSITVRPKHGIRVKLTKK